MARDNSRVAVAQHLNRGHTRGLLNRWGVALCPSSGSPSENSLLKAASAAENRMVNTAHQRSPHEARSNARLECGGRVETALRSARRAPQGREQVGHKSKNTTNVSFIRPPGHNRRSTASESHACLAMCKYIDLSRNWTPTTDIVLLGNTG
jgi:hypothetical protein